MRPSFQVIVPAHGSTIRSISAVSPRVRTNPNARIVASGKASWSSVAQASKVEPFVTTSSTTVMASGETAEPRLSVIDCTCVSAVGRSPRVAVALLGTHSVRTSSGATSRPSRSRTICLQSRSAGHSQPDRSGALLGHLGRPRYDALFRIPPRMRLTCTGDDLRPRTLDLVRDASGLPGDVGLAARGIGQACAEHEAREQAHPRVSRPPSRAGRRRAHPCRPG